MYFRKLWSRVLEGPAPGGRRMISGLLALSLFFGVVGQVRSDPVHALFDVASRTNAPFPSDWFTVADDDQNTGRRVNLPLPNPSTARSD